MEFSTEDTKQSAEGPQHFVMSWHDGCCLQYTMGDLLHNPAWQPLTCPYSPLGHRVARGSHESPWAMGHHWFLWEKDMPRARSNLKLKAAFSTFLNPWFSLKNKLSSILFQLLVPTVCLSLVLKLHFFPWEGNYIFLSSLMSVIPLPLNFI